MKQVYKSLILSALLGGGISSCHLTPYEIPVEEAYTRAFIKQFGVIDKNQDWNIAERKAVTVNPGNATQVKVYAYVGNTKYIFANYQDVQGTQTLEFDLPEGIEEVIVRVNGVEKTAKVGETVDFSGTQTRGGYYGDENLIKRSTVEDEANWLYFSEEAMSYANELPEKQYNLGKVIQNFTLKATDDFIIYPIFWQTERTHTLGIYYFPEGTERTTENMIKVPIYTMKDSNDDVFFKVQKGTIWEKVQDINWVNSITNKSYQQLTEISNDDLEIIKDEFVKKYETDKGVDILLCELGPIYNDGINFRIMINPSSSEYKPIGNNSTNPTYTPFTTSDITNWGNHNQDFFLSKGIKVSVPSGLEFGLYVDTGSDDKDKFYSEAEFNPDDFKNSDGTIDNTKKACHASIFKDEQTEWTLFGFEDWISSSDGADFDLNDFVCRIAGVNTTEEKPEDPPVIPDDKDKDDDDDEEEDKPFAWLVACEDLGNTGDIDFNDIVFKVEHVAGQTTATFTPLATGATLESYVYYTDANNEETPVTGTGNDHQCEIHRLLGGEAPSFINTVDGRGSEGQSHILNVGKDFSMAYIGEKGSDGTLKEQNMGGFVIKTFGREQYSENGWAAVTLTHSPGLGEAPMMICLPYEYSTGNDLTKWAWPKERIHISQAYPDFKDWLNSTTGTDWYKNPEPDYVVK